MRYWTGLALLLIAGMATAQVYKYVDEKGVIHYTDKPPTDDAKPVELPPLQTYSPQTVNVPSTNPKAPPAPAAALPRSEFQVNINSPTPEQTYREINPDVVVAVDVMPALVEGMGLIYYADDTAVTPEPIKDTRWTIGGLFRGEHNISVALVDSTGKEIARSVPVTVHMKPPSVPLKPEEQAKHPAH